MPVYATDVLNIAFVAAQLVMSQLRAGWLVRPKAKSRAFGLRFCNYVCRHGMVRCGTGPWASLMALLALTPCLHLDFQHSAEVTPFSLLYFFPSPGEVDDGCSVSSIFCKYFNNFRNFIFTFSATLYRLYILWVVDISDGQISNRDSH